MMYSRSEAYVPFLVLVLWTLLPLFCKGQDPIISDSTKIGYELDLGFGAYYQFSSFGSTDRNEAVFPQGLGRRRADPAVRDAWRLSDDRVTDNPFFHGAYFMKLGGRFSYGRDFTVVGSIIGEQRGFSDGVFSERTRNMYTYLNAVYSKSYGKFSYFIQAGDFWNFKLYEGLTFGNLETQSWIFKLQYGNFYFKHAGIGDLLLGIGLGIDDLYDYSIGAESLYIDTEKRYALDVRLGRSSNRGSVGGGFTNLSLRLTGPEDNYIYAQFSGGMGGMGSAVLLGAKYDNNAIGRFALGINVEVRRYTAAFNDGYVSTIYYRRPDERAAYTNSTNRVFVPLDFFERKFNQWALYTEYRGEDVTGLSTVASVSYRLFRSSYIKLDLDVNKLVAKSESTLYPFYDFGYAVRPVEELEISLSVTNRVINLDKNYPTLYRAAQPYFLLRMYRPLKMIREGGRTHRRLLGINGASR